jgi:serine/threonine protein kinase
MFGRVCVACAQSWFDLAHGSLFAALRDCLQERIAAQAATIRAGGGGDNTALEKCLMYKLRGRPHVIQLLEVWHDPKNVHTVMEYLQEDLIGLLNRVGVLNEATVQRVFAHMCVGLKQLHDLGYCHRDLSPENVLVTSDAKAQPLAKVIDFGMACPLAKAADGAPADLPGMRVPFGKMSYLSPEYYGKSPYNGAKNDLWALGCTLFTVSERKMLFDHPSVADAKFSYLASNRHGELFAWSRATNHAWDTVPEAQRREPMSAGLQDLLTGLLQVDPSKRVATVDEVLAHPWVKPYVDIAAAEFTAAAAAVSSASASASASSSSASASSSSSS